MTSLTAPAFRLLRRLALLAFLPIAVLATEPLRTTFDIPAGDAAETLRLFTTQAKSKVKFASNAVRGIQTNAVKGVLSAQEALAVMTEGTPLRVDGNVASGDFRVRRERTVAIAEEVADNRPAPRRAETRSPNSAVQLDDYEVIGAKIEGLNDRSLFPVSEEAALPYTVYTRDEIDQMGLVNTEDFFGQLPQSQNYGTNSQQQVGYSNVVGGQSYSVSAVDMGFGSQNTVVLVNGRLLGQGTTFAGPDISRIPIDSIERIEVLPAASAAIYGGGSVGGAINIIQRKDYNSKQLRTYLGMATNGGGEALRISYMDGRSFNGGRTKLTTSLEYNHKGGVRHGQRDFLQRAMEKYGPNNPAQVLGVSVYEAYIIPAFAGMPATIRVNTPSNGLSLGIPGNPTARWAALPSGLTDAQANALTPASFNATAGSTGTGNRHSRSWLFRPQVNYSIDFKLEHEILPAERLDLYSELSLGLQTADISYPQSLVAVLPANHDFNPFRTGVTPGFVGRSVVVYYDLPDVEDPNTVQERQDARLTVGVRGKVGKTWSYSLDASGQYARLFADSTNRSNYFQLMLNSVGSSATRAPLAERWALWNPFVDHTVYPVSEEHHDRYFYYNRQSSSYNRNAQLAFRTRGELWDLPAGPIRLSTGGILRVNQFYTSSETQDSLELRQLVGASVFPKTLATRSDTARSAYVETMIPVFSKKWSPVGLQSLELQASRRWAESNRGRNTISNTLAGNVWIIKDVMFRASITDGFIGLTPELLAAPTVDDNVAVTVLDPERGNIGQRITVPVRISGGNPLLRTPGAHSLNYGVVLKPRFIDGLTVNVNYTSTKQIDSVATPSLVDILEFPESYPGRLERAPLTPDDIAAGYTAGAITLLDVSRMNMAFRGQETFSYAINYRLPVPREYGTVSWNVNANHLNSQRSRARPIDPTINSAGVRNLKWKGNSTITWSKDRWMVGVTGNYNSSYYDSTTAPTAATPTATGLDGRKIKHSVNFDFRGSYNFPAGAMGDRGLKSLLGGTSISVGIQNVLDDMGPFVTDGTGWYSRFTSPMQRYVYLDVKKLF
jgi:iron complex outermembrane recepter protein